MRTKPKIATSPLGMAFSPVSEMHRVQEKLLSNRRFEPEFFNANRLVQPDLFRIEKRHTSHQWVDKNSRFIVTNCPESRNSNFIKTESALMKQTGLSKVSTIRSNNANSLVTDIAGKKS